MYDVSKRPAALEQSPAKPTPPPASRGAPVVMDADATSMSAAKTAQAEGIAAAEIAARTSSSGGRGVELSGVELVKSPTGVEQTTDCSGYGFCHPHVRLLWNDQEKKVGTADGGKWRPSAKIEISAPPFVRPRPDKVDITAANSPLLNQKNCAEAVADLRPDSGVTPAGRAPRKQFFSSAIVARHELYHRDDFMRAADATYAAVKGKVGRARLTSAEQAEDLMESVRHRVEAGLWEVYAGSGATTRAKAEGVAFGSRPGEVAAYADGAPVYEKLADDIESRFARK